MDQFHIAPSSNNLDLDHFHLNQRKFAYLDVNDYFAEPGVILHKANLALTDEMLACFACCMTAFSRLRTVHLLVQS